MSAFYISAAHKSSGKTTLSIGLAKAIRDRGLTIQPFKKGPDYIDPIWLSQASGRDCHNLDFFTSGREYIRQCFRRLRTGADVTLVEGNMGLFDGLSLDGSDSNAAMARLLDLPVVLVVDCSGTSRGIAPLLIGYRDFDPSIRHAGVILNKVAGSRHETKMREMIERYTDFRILGAVPRNHDIQVTERHLGLIPGNEMGDRAGTVIDLLAHQAASHIDIDALLDSTRQTASTGQAPDAAPLPEPDLRVAIARDTAFGFYYPDDLLRFAELGVELVAFDTIADNRLPADIDGLFIGGGFPETQVEPLSANLGLLTDIRQSIREGLPAYAECGGLMYLSRDLMQAGTAWPMVNVIPASVVMSRKPQGRGYVILEPRPGHPWYRKKKPTRAIHAHEFHYSSLEYLDGDLDYGYAIKRGTGIDGMNDGIIRHNLVASYTHLRSTDLHSWVDDFVSFIRQNKEGR
jgi:cobyrinic acid a,c-diamide synthase